MMLNLTYAHPLERIFANMLDTGVRVFVAAILGSIAGPLSLLALLGTIACDLVYHVISTASRWQATPGQRLLSLKVVRADGRQINEAKALERYLAFQMPMLPLYLTIAPPELLGVITSALVLIWLLPIIWRSDRQGMHDVLCQTFVIRERA